MNTLVANPRHVLNRKLASIVAAGVLAALPIRTATALVVDPFFQGHQTTTLTYPDPYFVQTNFTFTPWSYDRVYISPNGIIDDGGFYGGSSPAPGDWGYFDFNIIAPLWNHIDLSQGGVITYGNPTPNTFAVSWVNVHNADDPSVVNTFQVVLVGGTGLSTNTGVPISPGSIIFGYGNGTNGTVDLSPDSPAAIGVLDYGNTPSLQTLQSLGIGDVNGILSPADLPTLLASGDPFLLNFDPGTGFSEPIAFTSVPGLTVPEPATLSALGAGLAAVALAKRRKLPR